MRTKTKARLSLIATLGVSLFAVVAASISTYAWFQSTSAASVETDGDEVDITVAAPDDITIGTPHLYKYNDNFYVDDPTIDTDDVDISYGNGTGWTEVTNSTVDSENMYPGQKATYCIVVSASAGSDKSKIWGGSLAFGDTTSFTTTKPTGKTLYKLTGANEDSATLPAAGSRTEIDFSEAILVSGIIKTSNSAIYNDDIATNGKTPADDISLCSINSVNVDSLYIYFTIWFSNDSGTFYQEYVQVNSSYKPTYEKQTASTRYFYKTPNGNSNCYEGWKFKINTLVVSVY